MGGASFAQYDGIKISKTINTWAKDIATYSKHILSFHSAVECIKNNFDMDLEKPAPKNSPSPPAHAGHINLPSVTPPQRQMNPIQSSPYPTSAFRLGFEQQQYPTAQLPGTISHTLRPISSRELPQKRQLPPPQNDPKRMKQ